MKKFHSIISNLEARPRLGIVCLGLLLLVVLIPHFIVSYECYVQSLMPDLHFRITGSRLLDYGKSPYFYQWKPGDTIRLYNPNMFLPNGLNGVTVPPFFLWLQLPLSRLPYCDIKYWWWIITEALLVTTILFTCLVPKTLLRQLLTLTVAVLFFTYSRNWWLHLYNGQVYIVYGCVFAVTAYLFLNRKSTGSPGILFPLFALLRPFFTFALLPFFLEKPMERWKSIVIGGILSIVLLAVSSSYKTMPEYSKAMKLYSEEITGWSTSPTVKDYRSIQLQTEECVYNKTSFPVFGTGALFSLQHYLKVLGWKINSMPFYTAFLIITVVSFLFIHWKAIFELKENIVLASFLIYILCEFFTPAQRNPYNIIQYAGIIGVLLNRSLGIPVFLFVFGLVLNHDIPVRLPYMREAGEILMLGAVYLAIINVKKPGLVAS